MPTFDFTSVTPESLKSAMKTEIQESGLEIDLREGSYTDHLLSPVAYQLYKLYAYFPMLLAAAAPSANSGEFLDSFGAMFGIDRTQGAKASAPITFQGENGAVIPAGTVVVSEDGLRFVTDAAGTIAEGTATVMATAESVGDAYNLPPGTVSRLLVTIPGVTGVSNSQGSGGADVESDEAYYSRIHTYLSTPVASGNANHYKMWALEIAGVGVAAVQPLWAGAGTVKVIVASQDKEPLDDSVVNEVAVHIGEKRPIGADVTVVSVEPLEVSAAAAVTLDETTTEAVGAALSTELQLLFRGLEVGVERELRYNRIFAMLLSLPGVVDCSTFTINGDTANLTLSADQVPMLGTITITEG